MGRTKRQVSPSRTLHIKAIVENVRQIKEIYQKAEELRSNTLHTLMDMKGTQQAETPIRADQWLTVEGMKYRWRYFKALEPINAKLLEFRLSHEDLLNDLWKDHIGRCGLCQANGYASELIGYCRTIGHNLFNDSVDMHSRKLDETLACSEEAFMFLSEMYYSGIEKEFT